jgi:AcrR family transcriptional regulator
MTAVWSELMESPRERRQARTRRDILDAALSLIGEEGPDNFTLRALARRVDYSPAGLYEYFDGKEDIIEAVCAEGDRRLRMYLRRVPTDLAPDRYLTELGLAYIRFALRNEQHFVLMFAQKPNRPTVNYQDIAADKTYSILLDGVQAAIDAGLFQTRDDFTRDDIAYGLWALAHGLAVMQLTSLHNVAHDFSQADRGVLEAFIGGLVAQ